MPPNVSAIPGTSSVYVFRQADTQSLFVVGSDGVLVTDPASQKDPDTARRYLDAIRAMTSAPIRYVVYTHHHYDRTAGGVVFQEPGTHFVAHRRTAEYLALAGRPDIVSPDRIVHGAMTLRVGGTNVELLHIGKHHTDSSLVLRIPAAGLLYAMEAAPIRSVVRDSMVDSSPLDWMESLRTVLAMEWTLLVTEQPLAAPGTREDMRAFLGYLEALSAEAKRMAPTGECRRKADFLPDYSGWQGYAQYIDLNRDRFCNLWSNGIVR